MFVLTVDQVGSRSDVDRVQEVLADAARWRRRGVVLGPDRTAGDEFQLVLPDAADALACALDLNRDGRWSTGLGVGSVRRPLPATTREATGDAFSAAREAVDAAKRTPYRLVVAAARAPRSAADVTALLHLLLDVRARRSPEGWAVADLLAEGLSQAEVAERQGVTPQAISQRARAGGLRAEDAALPALQRLLAALDEEVGGRR